MRRQSSGFGSSKPPMWSSFPKPPKLQSPPKLPKLKGLRGTPRTECAGPGEPRAVALIEQAIHGRLQVVATYHGRHREFCPHLLGTTDGERRVFGFQFAGESEDGLPPGGEWRCFRVGNLEGAEMRPGPWFGEHAGIANQECIEQVELEAV
jgi:hypothetical protein